MPNIKKIEYDELKSKALVYDRLYQQHLLDIQAATNQTATINLLKTQLEMTKMDYRQAMRAFEETLADAVRETFKVEETVEIPGCFSPMDTVKYIVERQENPDGSNCDPR
jgi:hypothetical protein